MKQFKKLDIYQDLSKGDRQYLGRKGISGSKFDKMSAKEQNEWKEEMKSGSYANNDRDNKTQNNRFNY